LVPRTGQIQCFINIPLRFCKDFLKNKFDKAFHPEIARQAKLRKDSKVDLFGLRDFQGPKHFVLVGFNVGDHGVQVGDPQGKMAIILSSLPEPNIAPEAYFFRKSSLKNDFCKRL